MAEFVRPAPDLQKIAEAWDQWIQPDDDAEHETLPGRTMADLKIAGSDKVIETISQDNPDHSDIAAVHQAWTDWERGRTGPGDALAALAEAGFGRIVEGLSSPPPE